ncbi:MAG: DNA polymerase III subunit delta' [Paucibacter sp.]|nr:DNA polymerase III subunit delta' [Roseateles sp.]
MLPWLEPTLLNTLATSRSHALLLQGPAGVGQFELAVNLAQSWLCESPQGGGRACDHCASCLLFKARTHPDLQILVPEALREGLGLVDEAETAKESKTKPSREIKIDAVRAMLSFAQASSARGQAKVVIVHPAEALNTVAANALLKTLEEPAGRLRFVLTCSAPESLLPTIRSRCQPVSMALPETAQALAWLRAQGLPEADAQTLLAAAGGRPQEARDWFESGLKGSLWNAVPQAIERGQSLLFNDWPVPRAIDALLRLCHDLLCQAHGAAPRFFGAALLPKLQSAPPLLEWEQRLRQAARHAEHPLNAGLLMASLVAQGQQALRAASRRELH